MSDRSWRCLGDQTQGIGGGEFVDEQLIELRVSRRFSAESDQHVPAEAE